MQPFDIAPFCLPNCGPGEIRFEEPRDILGVEVFFKGPAPKTASLFYLRHTWPGEKIERREGREAPAYFGWMPGDDQFNSKWHRAQAKAEISGGCSVFRFLRLSREFPECAGDYDVEFRRTLGLKVEGIEAGMVRGFKVFTTGLPAVTLVRLRLDAGRESRGRSPRFEGYNARPGKPRRITGRTFEIPVAHMKPAHAHSHDEGHLRVLLGKEMFTVSLQDLAQGPVWHAEEGCFLRLASDPCDFAAYRQKTRASKTVLQQVRENPEQSYGGAFHGQPKPHAPAYTLGWKHARQRFWLEPNGDLVLHKGNVSGSGDVNPDAARWIRGRDTDRFLCEGNARFFFSLQSWNPLGRHPDPAPVPAYNIRLNRGPLVLEQKSFALPLLASLTQDDSAGDETMAALLRFKITNTGAEPALAEIPLSYSQKSRRSLGALDRWCQGQDDDLVPESPRDALAIRGHALFSGYQGKPVLRCAYSGSLKPAKQAQGVVFRQLLKTGQSGELVLKIPFVALDRAEELAALKRLDFDRSYPKVAAFWCRENRGAQLETPVAQLDALHASHLAHVQVTDFAMPGDSALVNTSVGSSTYGNYSNESCMVIQELDQRGLHDEAQRRLEVWIRYQGTVSQPGNFSDCRGMYFGAGGFESGAYNQHHGWVLWCMAEHYFLSRDKAWLERSAASIIAGADWVFRQRRLTRENLPHSRGWERGFLPAGSLEDVTDFHYWLSTNALTWRGTQHAARALAAIGHPEAARVRKESEAYGRDLVQGFETIRQHSPLVRLRDGRWVPHYPSRLYNRGRDTGWIREVLEGAVYLLISGLYAPNSRQAEWILNDFQDNLYHNPPFGFVLVDEARNLFDRGGFSIQPNLLAGLMPHLWRDEPEIYQWMFFNSWCACYREEIQAMVEHPMPELGFDNAVPFKTSDEANAVMWLRYLLVAWDHEVLHLGRAMPRAWMADGQVVKLKGLSTYFGQVDLSYLSRVSEGLISLDVEMKGPQDAPKVLARFRHPESRRMKSAWINGKPGRIVDAVKGDVDLTGRKGKLKVEARY